MQSGNVTTGMEQKRCQKHSRRNDAPVYLWLKTAALLCRFAVLTEKLDNAAETRKNRVMGKRNRWINVLFARGNIRARLAHKLLKWRYSKTMKIRTWCEKAIVDFVRLLILIAGDFEIFEFKNVRSSASFGVFFITSGVASSVSPSSVARRASLTFL